MSTPSPQIAVIETDWSEDGCDRHVDDGPVGPDHIYLDVFAPMARMIGARVDYAQFASREGFTALLRRFGSHRNTEYLMVGGHGSEIYLYPPGGRFKVFDALERELAGKQKKGLILASCDLGESRAPVEALIDSRCFEWVAAYRRAAHPVASPLIEITFWRALLGGWSWRKTNSTTRTRAHRVASGGEAADPIVAGLLTKLEIASAVASRFDVRSKPDGVLVSSLEVFSALVNDEGVHHGHLDGVAPDEGSQAALERYRGLLDKVWRYQWERYVE